MSRFIFKDYHFDSSTNTANFSYTFDDGRAFTEVVQFNEVGEYDERLLDRALFLAFVLIGVSYFKTFPTAEVEITKNQIDDWQAKFFSSVYQEGLSQFAFENQLARRDLAQFRATTDASLTPLTYTKTGALVLESGGKDSLLTALLLRDKDLPFDTWYLTTSDYYPRLLKQILTSEQTF